MPKDDAKPKERRSVESNDPRTAPVSQVHFVTGAKQLIETAVAEWSPMVRSSSAVVYMRRMDVPFTADTAEGNRMQGQPGDWVAVDPESGHVWPVKADYCDRHYTSPQTMTPEAIHGAFHVKDGWFVDRVDGSIRIRKFADGREGSALVVQGILTMADLNSIVRHVQGDD